MTGEGGVGRALRAVVPFVLLACVVAAAAWRGRARGETRPLPRVRTVVLLLAPGASLDDWRRDAPGLIRLGEGNGGALALTPTRSGRREPADSKAAFSAAVETVAYGSREPSPGAISLGDAVQASGGRVLVLNGGPALAPFAEGAAREAFRRPDPAAPFGVATDDAALTSAIHATAPGMPTLTVAVYDDLLRAEDEAPLCLPVAADALRRGALRRLNALGGRLAADLPRDAALLVVTPTPSADAAARRERAAPLLLYAPGQNAPTLLASPSTRGASGLLPNTDIAATVAVLLGLPEERRHVGAERAALLMPPPLGNPAAFLARRAAAWAAQAREQRILVSVPWVLAALLLASVWLGLRGGRERLAGACAVAPVAAPLALLALAPLAPTAEGAAWVIFALTGAFAAVAALLAARTNPGTWARGLTAAIAAVLVLDTLLGGPLLARSPLSYSVLEGARFYGVGNEASGLLLGSTLLTAAALCAGSRVGVAACGLAVALVSGLPMLGADAGGLAADLAGFAALAWLLGGGTVRNRRAVGVLVGAVVALLLLLTAYAAWDAGRGAGARTHVGEAVAAARARGAGAIGAIALRKAQVNARLLATSPWAVLLASEAGTLWYLTRRRGAALKDGERAALWGAGALFLLNDSGVVAAATCLLYPTASLLTRGTREEKTAA